MRFTWKHSSALLLLCVFLLGLQTFSAEDAREVLRQAFVATSKATYTTPVTDTSLLKELNATSGEFHRLVLTDGFVCRKIILKDANGKTICIFTQNREGCFAMINEKWCSLPDIVYLWHFDVMASPPRDFEMKIATFSSETINIRGRSLLLVRMDTAQDVKKLQWGGTPECAIFAFPGADNLFSGAYAKRPMHRVFLLDPNTYMIRHRIHYNLRRQKLYEANALEAVVSPSLRESDFAPNGRVHADFFLLNEGALAQYLNQVYRSRHPIKVQRKSSRTHMRINHAMKWIEDAIYSSALVFVLRLLGIASLAVICLIYWKRHRNTLRP